MEIDVPHQPLRGWRETGKHLAIVTVGVLIALTLEGIVSWVDHRRLVHDAVENLTAELRGNKVELDGLFARLEQERHQLEHAGDLAARLGAGPVTDVTLTIESHDAELKNAALTTGQITGALGYMRYDQVREYADAYDLQAQFMRLQEREDQHVYDVLSFTRRVAEHPTADAIERWNTQIDVALTGISVREQLARQLDVRYEKLLQQP